MQIIYIIEGNEVEVGISSKYIVKEAVSALTICYENSFNIYTEDGRKLDLNKSYVDNGLTDNDKLIIKKKFLNIKRMKRAVLKRFKKLGWSIVAEKHGSIYESIETYEKYGGNYDD